MISSGVIGENMSLISVFGIGRVDGLVLVGLWKNVIMVGGGIYHRSWLFQLWLNELS